MLTKNLLKGRILDGFLKPTYITKKNALGNDAAAEIVKITKSSVGASYIKIKAKISEAGLALNPYVPALMKVLKDSFTETSGVDFEAKRWELIKAAQSERAAANTYEEFISAVEDRFNANFSMLASEIYGDLEDEAPMMLSDRELTAETLVLEYNIALAKGFLVKANEIEVRTTAHVSQLKKLFSRIKFHGLFVEDIALGESEAVFKVSGPLGVSTKVKTYGIKFVGLLGILGQFEKWSLTANIEHNGKKATLALSDKSPIVNKFAAKISSSYIPDEVEAAIKTFNQSEATWKLEPNCEILNFGDEHYSFPDLKAVSQSGKVLYVELFNRWSKKPFLNSCKQAKSLEAHGVVYGVDKDLLKDKEVRKSVDKCTKLQGNMFEFHDFPTARNMKKVLL